MIAATGVYHRSPSARPIVANKHKDEPSRQIGAALFLPTGLQLMYTPKAN